MNNIKFNEPDIWRGKLLNEFCVKYELKSYLEIGYLNGLTFNLINCNKKIGVDPNPQHISNDVVMKTSDEFFLNNVDKFDLVFIDGNHEKNQVYRDFKNSYNALTENGIIVFHDINPPSKDGTALTGHGDCFETWINMFNKYKLFTYTNNFDCVGIFSKKLNSIWIDFDMAPHSYEYFEQNRNKYITDIRINENLEFNL